MCSDEQRVAVRTGQPETGDDSGCFNNLLIKKAIPSNGSTILDIAPVNQESQSIWMALTEDGQLLRYGAQSGEPHGKDGWSSSIEHRGTGSTFQMLQQGNFLANAAQRPIRQVSNDLSITSIISTEHCILARKEPGFSTMAGCGIRLVFRLFGALTNGCRVKSGNPRTA